MDNNVTNTSQVYIFKKLWLHKYRLHSVDKLYIALQKRRKKKTLDLPEANQHPVRFNSPQQRIEQNRRKEIQKIFAVKKRMELKIMKQMLSSTHSQVKHCTFSGPYDLFYEQICWKTEDWQTGGSKQHLYNYFKNEGTAVLRLLNVDEEAGSFSEENCL